MTPEVRKAGAISRFPGEKWADFAARQRAAQLAAMPVKDARREKTRPQWEARRQKAAEDAARAAREAQAFNPVLGGVTRGRVSGGHSGGNQVPR